MSKLDEFKVDIYNKAKIRFKNRHLMQNPELREQLFATYQILLEKTNYELLQSLDDDVIDYIIKNNSTGISVLNLVIPYKRDYIGLVSSHTIYHDFTRDVKKFSYTIPNPFFRYKIILNSPTLIQTPKLVRFRLYSSKVTDILHQGYKYAIYHFGTIISEADLNYVEQYLKKKSSALYGVTIPTEEILSEKTKEFKCQPADRVVEDNVVRYNTRDVKVSNIYPRQYFAKFLTKCSKKPVKAITPVNKPKFSAVFGVLGSVKLITYPLRDTNEQEILNIHISANKIS